MYRPKTNSRSYSPTRGRAAVATKLPPPFLQDLRTEVNVKWEDNDSVRALADLAAKGPVTIDTSLYGGFEQVGGLGTTLPNNDVDTTTGPGDIVLYSGNNIVVFFGTNTWAYTRLGHIEGKSRNELRDMLGSNKAVLTITSTEP